MSKCTAVSKFAQPAQRHKWSAIREIPISESRSGIYRFCLNDCGATQVGTEIPASVRRQFELEQSVRERIARRK